MFIHLNVGFPFLQSQVLHPQQLLQWLPAPLASSLNGAVFHALIITVTLQDTQCATAQVVRLKGKKLCIRVERAREPILQHCWHPIPATPFRWQQLPTLEPLDLLLQISQ